MSNASDCSSYSYCPEFKNYINVDNSSLFYVKINCIDSEQKTTENAVNNSDNLFRNEFKRMSLRREKGILSKLTTSKKSPFDFRVLDRNKYQHADGVLKELKIGLKSGKLVNYAPQKRDKRSLFEIMFNATLILGPEKKKLMIDKINQNSVFEKDLVVGDYIKSIDGEIVSADNLNFILKKIQNQKSFKLVAQECFKDESDYALEEVKLINIKDIVTMKDKLFKPEAESHELIFSLNIIVKNEQADESEADYDTIFSYPPMENNFIYQQKGSFLTLVSLLKSTYDKYPTVTTIQVHDTTFYVTYSIRNEGNEITFLGFNQKYAEMFDAEQHTFNFIKFLDFIYPKFSALQDIEYLTTLCEMIKIQLVKRQSHIANFEQLFSLSKSVALPKEIILRINDALSELEAMDYRNWNELLIELFGKFNIIGSCLFYKTSLICSHFNEKDMENVELWLRHMCVKFLYENCTVREMAIWQRIYPKDYQSFNMENDSTKNKVFLLAASRGNLLMCVILEENGYNNNNPDVETQSSNYLIHFLEEMEDVIDHLKIVGIENLTKIWINAAKRPQCKEFASMDSKAEDQGFLKNIKEENECDEEESESQIDSQRSSSGFDNEDTFYKDFNDIIPQSLTGPENVLYHFTQLDFAEGVLLTSINEDMPKDHNTEALMDIFRKGCLEVHKMLQRTIKFNKMLAKEYKISNKPSILPKEQGMLFTYHTEKSSIEFWIVGRLFGKKELFVCYDAKVPQNMVEIAFRIGLNSVG